MTTQSRWKSWVLWSGILAAVLTSVGQLSAPDLAIASGMQVETVRILLGLCTTLATTIAGANNPKDAVRF